jgi:arginyl-tRNA synthetase
MDFEEKIKEAIVKAVGSANIKKEEIFLEKPKENFGDYSFPCFQLAKVFKKNPHDISRELIQKMEKDLKKTPEIEKVEAVAGYLNFFIDKEVLIKNILVDVKKPMKLSKTGKKETILVESPGPNTNKPLHVGHLRNLFIGDSIARIFEFFNNKVVRVDVINDRGIHVCKSMLAYQKWGDNKTPEQAKRKSDHFVGDFYVLFSQKLKQNPKLEEEAQEMLKKWEQGDRETIDLWKKMNKWAIDGMKETYKLLNFKHDRQYFESETYKQGKDIVLEGVKKGLFKKNNDDSVSIDLGDLGEKILLRQDGTTVYITQDLYMAKKRYEDYKFNKMFYVVASEQNYHFKTLFKILDTLGYKWSKECFHISYGMVNLPSGKMKSREGTIIDADDLIKEIKEDSKQELKKRYPELSEKELDLRSLAIALSAIKFALLKVDLKKDILFNKEEALDFEGFSGPYLQYSYARAYSILNKLPKSRSARGKSSFKNLNEQEIIIVKKLSDFSDVVERAKNEIKPDLIALYAYELSQIFNNFYHNCPVIKAEKTEQARRIEMIHSFSKTMKNCLDILGIVALEEM